MNKPGPKPKPTRLKLLSGMRAQRVNPSEPKVIPGTPRKPSGLTRAGQAKWDQFCDILERMGIMSQSDGDAIYLYCVAYEQWLAARADVQDRGVFVDTPQGGTKANPSCAIRAIAAREMLTILTAFGLTPSARSQIRMGGGADARDSLDEFMRSKPG